MYGLSGDVELSAAEAACIAHAMREVAQADGSIHQRELALIAQFEAELPADARPAETLGSQKVRQAFLRSVLLVALADGVITEDEERVIGAMCEAQGIGRGEIHAETLEVKRWFLSTFRGVQIFQDAVVRVAENLGLPSSEIDALRGVA
jgi:tellurite resistance protein